MVVSQIVHETYKLFHERHPELRGVDGTYRVITSDPKDEAYRAEWWKIHAQVEAIHTRGYTSCDIGGTIQPCPDSVKEKRARMAAEANAYVKKILRHGAGNQYSALKKTNFNSFYRLKVARDKKKEFFNYPEEVESVARQNDASWAAYSAAKAQLAEGGNCGEHALLAYDYLRRNYPEETVSYANKTGLDHAFVIIGDPSAEDDDSLMVADPWPTNPQPVGWKDHFAYTPDRKNLNTRYKVTGDPIDYKAEMFKKGLSLNKKGRSETNRSVSPRITNHELERGARNGGWIWDHDSTLSDDARTRQTETPTAISLP